MSDADHREAFNLFDKRGRGSVPREPLSDLFRAVNTTQAEVAELASDVGNEVDFNTFLHILNRPNEFKPSGTPGVHPRFRVFDKEGSGCISVGELRYLLTSLGEKLENEEVDELLKNVQVGASQLEMQLIKIS
ncbi:unnamed protein product [Tilletia controversa]|nr:unnamed protein product [Tilletia controversa]